MDSKLAQLQQAGLSPPEILTFAITGKCNLQCAHCWVDAGPAVAGSWLPTRTVQRLLEEFAELGGLAVRLTGGEPLLHPDWLELVSIAAAVGLSIVLQTNGMLFTESNLQALQSLELADLNIQISLDGATAASHDLVRGAGAYAQTLQGIQRLIEYGFAQQLDLFFTEMRHNLHELPDLLLLAERLGVAAVSSGSLVVCGRARTDGVIAPPDPEQYPELLQRYADDSQFRQAYEKLGCIATLEWCRSKTSRPGCAFVKTPYLTATGILYPCLLCHADDYSVAGVFEKGLASALNDGAPCWSSLQAISQQRAAALAECQACALLESCAAGCMGRAFGSFGDFIVAEDRCQQRRAVLRWKEKNR